nr:GTP-binding protein [Cryptomonas sp.]
MFTVNKAGDIQLSTRWIENFGVDLDSSKKIHLSFLSHIGSNRNDINKIMKYISPEGSYSQTCNEIDGHIDCLDWRKIHLSFWFEIVSLESIRILKFMFMVSNSFLIYLNSYQNIFDNNDYLVIIMSLFIFAILDSKTRKNSNITIFFIMPDITQKVNFDYEKENVIKQLEKVWEKCLEITGFSKNNSLSSFFVFEFASDNSFVNEEKKNCIDEMEKSRCIDKEIVSDSIHISELINKKWIDSRKLPIELFFSLDNQIIRNQISFYFSDSILYKFSRICNQVFKKWSKVIYRGKIIKNFGCVLSDFLNCISKQFDLSVPLGLEKCSDIANKKAELVDIIREKASFFFTRQLLNLQSQALDKFRGMLLNVISDSKTSFETIKKLSIDNINNWFVLNAKCLLSNSIKLSYYPAQKELNSVLLEFAEKFKDSPVVKLQSLQRLEKQTSVSGLKQSGIVIGFGLTAAFRPNGFGNFQLITSYTQGPHIFNFSLVNDKDVAEQEGQGNIKIFRIQPSLSFDIEL